MSELPEFINLDPQSYTSSRRQRPVNNNDQQQQVISTAETNIRSNRSQSLESNVNGNTNSTQNVEMISQNANEQVIDSIENDSWCRRIIVPLIPIYNFVTYYSSPTDARNLLKAHNVYYAEPPTCNGGTEMYFEERKFRWRCNGKKIGQDSTGASIRCCFGSTKSERMDSFFTHRKISVFKTLLILYFWASKTRKSSIAQMVGVNPKTVRSVLDDWYQIMQEDIMENDCKIGGIDNNGNPIIVEIDESKFGKRKYNRGHAVPGVWVVGGVEKTPQRKCFFLTVNDRSKETLLTIIDKFVLPGSIVRTDCWKGYNGMEDLGNNITHETVNHSVAFLQDGVHTNTIEGSWNGVKINISPRLRNKDMVPWLLVEFIWRRKHFGDIWGAIMKCLGSVSLNRSSTNPPWLTQFGFDSEDDEAY